MIFTLEFKHLVTRIQIFSYIMAFFAVCLVMKIRKTCLRHKQIFDCI